MRHAKRLLLIGDASNYGRECIKGVLDYCHVKGNWEFRLAKDAGLAMVKQAQAAIREWKADGIIARIPSAGVECLLRNSGIPVVCVLRRSRQLKLPTITTDNEATGRLVARHFLGNGFRNFVYYAKTRSIYSRARCDGFVAELSGAGFNCEVIEYRDVPGLELHWDRDRQKLDRWLLSLKKPVGIMCVHDNCALEVSLVCHRLGIRVPDDVALVGNGNDELICQVTSPSLSSVEQDFRRIGYEAARLLHAMLRGYKARPKLIFVPPRRVVVRQSSDIVPVSDPEVAAALRFIRQHAHERIGVKNILQEVPISRKTLERRFERLISRSPRQDITLVRIKRSKYLLEDTELSIPDIAHKVGFTRQTIFSTFFHRETGLTPTQYRQNRRIGVTPSIAAPPR